MGVLLINASPTPRSRSAALLGAVRRKLQAQGQSLRSLHIADLPAASLLTLSRDDAAIRLAADAVREADAVVVATPVYKGAYSGLLKVFLDTLDADALQGKTVLSLATGSSQQQAWALDYALRPVLQALGARHMVQGVYAADHQLMLLPEGASAVLHDAVEHRLDEAVALLLDEMRLSGVWLQRSAKAIPFGQVRCSV